MDSIATLVMGALLGAVGTWLNERRMERRRVSAEREKAYVGWLEAQPDALAQIATLRGYVASTPHPDDDRLLSDVEAARAALVELSKRASACHVFETNPAKRALIDSYVTMLSHMVREMEILVRHQRLHIRLLSSIARADANVDAAQRNALDAAALIDPEQAEQVAELRKRAAEVLRQTQHARADARSHFDACDHQLATDVADLLKRHAGLDQLAPTIRETLLHGR